METTKTIQLKKDISKLGDEIEYLSMLGVEGMLLGELTERFKELTVKSNKLNLLIVELEDYERTTENNKSLDDFKEEY